MYGVFLQEIYINVIDGLAFNFLYFVIIIIIITFWNLLYVQPILSSQLQKKNRERKKILAVKKQGKIQTVRVETRKV